MEGKEEISDTDSGVILHSGPDSPTTVIKDVNTHTRAMKLKQQALEDKLKVCFLELKKLCIREAELTGHLSSDYPLLPGEKPPQIRRRIGAAFKLDEPSIFQRNENSELSSVETGLALQQQIYVAAQRLYQEEHLSKAIKRSRMLQYQREEKKLKDLQEAVFRLRLEHGRASPRPGMIAQRGTSDDSSLSDSAVLDEEELTSQSSQHSSEPPAPAVIPHPSPLSSSHPPPRTPTAPSYRPPEVILQTPPQSLENLHLCQSPLPDHDPAPIQNSPWAESSLDQPYHKQKKSHSSSTKSSPAVTPTLPPLEVCLVEAGLPLQIPTHAALRHTQSCSAPSTPEMHLRRGQSLRVPNSEPHYDPSREPGRSRGPRRQLTELAVTSRDYSPMRLNLKKTLYCSSSEDSNSEHSVQSYASSPCQEHPGELPWPYQPQYGYQYGSLADTHVLQRCSPTSFYKNYQHQSSPSFSRGYVEDAWGHPLDLDTGRSYISHQAPSPVYSNGHYEYCYNEAPPLQQRSCRVLPAHVRLSRAPSLREYPHHPTRGLPRQVVSEELKSWHQRSQRRPCSLDRNRQGALRIRSASGKESPLCLPQQFQEQQVLQKRVIVTTQDMMYEDDSEISSQV